MGKRTIGEVCQLGARGRRTVPLNDLKPKKMPRIGPRRRRGRCIFVVADALACNGRQVGFGSVTAEAQSAQLLVELIGVDTAGSTRCDGAGRRATGRLLRTTIIVDTRV